MATPMSRVLGQSPFPRLLPLGMSMRTVFDNGVEAEIGAISDRRIVPPTAPRDDSELLGDAMRALRDAPNVPPGRVVASVRDGIVALEGRTSFYYERAAAECAVRFLDGVRSVENHIMVEPPALAHEVRTCIAGALMRSAADEATQIAVQAVGDTVILQGVVHSRAERDVAERAAWTVSGVRSVIDNLIVSA
jgi:osmotically-inducible protein OsmY